jgi:hypothetical protein
MWTMLMQMIALAEAIGQGDCEASRTIGARTFVTWASFTHAATLSSASGSIGTALPESPFARDRLPQQPDGLRGLPGGAEGIVRREIGKG